LNFRNFSSYKLELICMCTCMRASCTAGHENVQIILWLVPLHAGFRYGSTDGSVDRSSSIKAGDMNLPACMHHICSSRSISCCSSMLAKCYLVMYMIEMLALASWREIQLASACTASIDIYQLLVDAGFSRVRTCTVSSTVCIYFNYICA
jgi:hypothetical protein